jgi:hypothetical protein
MPITSVTLYGHTICDHVWSIDGAFTAAEQTSLNTLGFQPTWTIPTKMMALFNSSLIAGNITYGAEQPQYWLIYRHCIEDNTLELAGKVDGSETSFIDYVIKNNKTYEYYYYAVTENLVGTAIHSDRITTNWTNWCLFSVDPTDYPNQYLIHEAIVLDLDITNAPMQNNTQTQVMHNFTKYPKIHTSPINYYSGAITSLIGHVDCATGKYTDSVDLEEQIKAMSTDGRRKFLKDRKGHLWEVQISAPISMQVRDTHIDQPYDVSLTWSEIGDANGLTITNKVRSAVSA